MSKQAAIVLLLACLVGGGVVFSIGFQATKPPSLGVGATIRDPDQYFHQQLRAGNLAHRSLRQVTLSARPSRGEYTYDTRFVLLGHEIADRVSFYRFDTNGTVLSITTHLYWPICHF